MNKGQAFTVFKMMIAAAFAMALLGIVYNVVNSVGCPSDAIDETKILLLQAYNAPDDCFERSNMCFDKGLVLSDDFYLSSIGLNVDLSDGGLNFCSGNECIFKSKVILPVKAICNDINCDLVLGQSCP